MNETTFRALLILISVAFVGFALVVFFPPIIENPDIVNVLKSGFVNPYASTYSVDLIVCWIILILWIIREKASFGVRNGWICIPIGLILGVAVGFALYLLIRGTASPQGNHTSGA